MNLKAIPNPHLIFPGQTLYLIKEGGYARLSTSRSNEPETVRISPRTRSDSLADSALPTSSSTSSSRSWSSRSWWTNRRC